MMRNILQDIMTKDVKYAAPDDSVHDVLRLMEFNKISCVPIVEGDRPVGMFTERNLVRYVARNNGRFKNGPVRDIMSTPVFAANQKMYLYEAYHILDSNGIRHLVVVNDDDKLVGVLTLSTIVNLVGNDLLIEFQPVHKLMNKMVYAVTEDLPLREMLLEMSERSISCIIYSENNQPAGILTERDIIRHAYSDPEFEHLSLKRIMKSPVYTVKNNTPVHQVVMLMREKSIRRVVVVNEDGAISGLATQTDIVKGLESRYIRVLRQIIEDKEIRLVDALRERDELTIYLESILDNSLGMGIIATDSELRIIYFNQFAEQLLGYHSDMVLERKVTDIHSAMGVDEKRLRMAMKKVCLDGSHTFTYEIKTEEESRFMHVRIAGIWDTDGDIAGYVHTIQDITEQKRAEDNIRFMAYHDMLTGLPNRVAFDERFSLELARAERNGEMLAVLVIDLDRFKNVNDTLGHYAGDMVLKGVSTRLQASLRRSDTLARFGGDEFAVVLPGIKSNDDALIVVNKIALAMLQSLDVKGESLRMTLSVGIAYYPEHGAGAKRLLHVADTAMYHAKNHGRDNNRTNYCVGVVDQDEDRQVVSAMNFD